MAVLSQGNGWLASGLSANNAAGAALDNRNGKNYGAIWQRISTASAIWALQVSYDNIAANFTTVLTVTAVTGAAIVPTIIQVSAYYPYVRVSATIFSGANNTGILDLYWTPGAG